MVTIAPAHARVVVPEGAPREQWMDERGEGVTASQAWETARGGSRAWKRILEAKMNGSRFRGNKATDAGHAREAALLDEAAERLQLLTPNGALWASLDNDLHRATPDAIGMDNDGRLVVVEVKSHEYGWESDDIPPEHMGQMQFQMHVLGAEWALYGFEVRDEDDMPPADGATWIPVARDQEMIDWLAYRADQFIAWRDAGCPDEDDLPADVAVALAKWAPLKVELDEAVSAEKAANAALKTALAKLPYADRFGAVGMGAHGGFQLTVSNTVTIHEAAWKAANPAEYERVQALRVELAFLEAEAKRTYPKVTRRSAMRFQEATGE